MTVRDLGRFIGRSKRFAASGPVAFTASTIFVFFYALIVWSILRHLSGYDFPRPPDISIPFVGSPRSWHEDSVWVSLALMSIVWYGVVSTSVRIRKEVDPAIPRAQMPLALAFKGSLEAFQYACQYLDNTLGEGRSLPAMIIDPKDVGADVAVPVKRLDNGRQLVTLHVASASGGFVSIAQTLGADGPTLKVGDFVAWRAVRYLADSPVPVGSESMRWVGLITCTLLPKWQEGAWLIDRKFA